MVRSTGIGPVSIAWKATILPLNYERVRLLEIESNLTDWKSAILPMYDKREFSTGIEPMIATYEIAVLPLN